MPLVAEADAAFFEDTVALDIDRGMRVHQNVVDRRIGKQRFQWSKSQDFVQKFVDQPLEFIGAHQGALV